MQFVYADGTWELKAGTIDRTEYLADRIRMIASLFANA